MVTIKNKTLLQSKESKVLFIALVIVIIAWFVMPPSGNKRELKQERKMHERALDSIRHLQKRQADSTSHWKSVAIQERELRIEAEQEREVAKKQKQQAIRKYESIRLRTHTDPQYDSVLTALFPSR